MSLHFETEARPSTMLPQQLPTLSWPLTSDPSHLDLGSLCLLQSLDTDHRGVGACPMTRLPAPFCLLTPCSTLSPGLPPLSSPLLPLSVSPFLPFPSPHLPLWPFFSLLLLLPPSSPPSSSVLLSYFLCHSLALAQGLGHPCMVKGSDNRVPHPHCVCPPDPNSYCTPTHGVHRCLLQRQAG